MDWWMVFSLGLQLLEGVLARAKGQGVALEQVENAEAALAELRKFHGSDVTKAQLESLRG